MAGKKTFRARIENPGGGGAFVRVPFEVEEAFGSKRPKVKATIDGVVYRGTLVRMGSEDHMLLILKEIREKIGKTFGDPVEVTLELDIEPRRVNIPPDLARALARDKAIQSLFERLSYTHQRENVRWIEDARRPETRRARVLKTIEMLRKGKEQG